MKSGQQEFRDYSGRPPQPPVEQEQRSSVKIGQTAAGKPVVEVKAYTNDLDMLDAARERAVAVFKATVAEVGGA